jgi:hypothetical protein
MPTTQSPLTAVAIAATRREMQAALDGPSGLDDADRVDAIRALEELACTVSAAQAALAAELADSVEADHEALGVQATRRGQGVAAQVALARRESPHRASATSGWPGSCGASSHTPGPPGGLAGSPSGAPR